MKNLALTALVAITFPWTGCSTMSKAFGVDELVDSVNNSSKDAWDWQGFSSAEKREWRKFFEDPKEAGDWKREGFSPEEAKKWATGNYLPKQARQKIEVDEAWDRDKGKLAKLRLTDEELNRWKDECKSVESVLFWTSHKVTLSEVAEWHAKGFSAEPAIEWRAAKFTPSDAANWAGLFLSSSTATKAVKRGCKEVQTSKELAKANPFSVKGIFYVISADTVQILGPSSGIYSTTQGTLVFVDFDKTYAPSDKFRGLAEGTGAYSYTAVNGAAMNIPKLRFLGE